MTQDAEWLVQISASKPVTELLKLRVANDMKIIREEPANDEEVLRFGIVEAMTIFGLIKAAMELTKVALELYRTLKERQAVTGISEEAIISLPGAKDPLIIRPDYDETIFRQQLAARFGVG